METTVARRCGKCGEQVNIPGGTVEQIVDAVGKPLCQGCFDLTMASRPECEEPIVMQRETKYSFTSDMGEISGFGGGYEQTCRNMLAAGLEWLDDHPEADPQFRGMEGVYGIIREENDDAKALSEAVVAGADGDCTGAMHQAVISSCLWIRKNGWEAYCESMRKQS